MLPRHIYEKCLRLTLRRDILDSIIAKEITMGFVPAVKVKCYNPCFLSSPEEHCQLIVISHNKNLYLARIILPFPAADYGGTRLPPPGCAPSTASGQCMFRRFLMSEFARVGQARSLET
jgi:hypothetical protein